jgi:hypothetical protein
MAGHLILQSEAEDNIERTNREVEAVSSEYADAQHKAREAAHKAAEDQEKVVIMEKLEARKRVEEVAANLLTALRMQEEEEDQEEARGLRPERPSQVGVKGLLVTAKKQSRLLMQAREKAKVCTGERIRHVSHHVCKVRLHILDL